MAFLANAGMQSTSLAGERDVKRRGSILTINGSSEVEEAPLGPLFKEKKGLHFVGHGSECKRSLTSECRKKGVPH
jgi:hypothetical protein